MTQKPTEAELPAVLNGFTFAAVKVDGFTFTGERRYPVYGEYYVYIDPETGERSTVVHNGEHTEEHWMPVPAPPEGEHP